MHKEAWGSSAGPWRLEIFTVLPCTESCKVSRLPWDTAPKTARATMCETGKVTKIEEKEGKPTAPQRKQILTSVAA